MIRYKSLRMLGTAKSAAVVFLFSSACLVSEITAQSAGSAVTGSSLSSPAPAPFLVAPSIPLGYAPSGVATGDLRRSGKLDLVTADYNSGKITVFLGTGQGKFAPGAEYDAGAHPSAVLVTDMNGDGRPDVLVSNESEGTISVLFGNGDGTLQPRQSYAVGFNPSFIATGDFNGSGKVDLAVAGKSGNLLAILLNDGDGNLQKPVLRSLSKTPTALTVADFNNDGHADLAIANADGTVSVLLGKGAGLFRSLPDIPVASGSISSINSGDFNRDAKIDLVVTQLGQKLVTVLIGRGDGTFASPASYPVGNEPVSTLVADVNGDGVPALVVINKSSNTFSILGGNGDGTFKTSVDFVAGNAPLAAVAGDFYGNGRADLAIINHLSQTVSVPLGNGDGTFQAARSYHSGVQPVSIASGNLNGGKIPALVVANYCGSDHTCGTAGNVAVFLADDKGAYRLSSTYPVGSGPVSVALADLTGGKNLDIVVLDRLDKTASVMLSAGDGTFRQPMTFPLAGAPIAVAVGDLNKDGKPDLAVLEDCGSAKCSQAGSVEILLGGGDGSLQSAASYPVGYSPVSVAVGAIDQDKNLDLVVANRCGKDASCQSAGTATVLIGDGTGKFTPGTDVALGKSPASMALGNLTGSGLDLVVSRSTDNTVAVLRGNGDGTFKTAVPYAVGNNPGSLVVADFNGDGKADVAVANVNDSTVSILYGHGDGTLQAASALAVGSGPTALTAIGRINTRHASLATANGNTGSSSPGTEFTVLPNLQSDPPLVTFVLVPSPAPNSSVNEGVLLTATLTGVTPNPAPSGTVTFDSGATALSDCTGVSITQGVSPSLISTATCTTKMLTAGSDSLTAVYSGDTIYDTGVGETSPAVTQTVAQLTPTLVLSGQGTSQVNQAVTFTATLGGVTFTPIAPGGTVTFTAGGNPISDCPAVTVNATTLAPTCATSTLTAGTDSIAASYTGDSNYAAASATAVTQTVSKLTPTLVLSGQGSSQVNQPVTFTATLGGVTFTPTAPGGTVTFTAGGNPISDCPAVTVNATTLAPTCATSTLAIGSDSIGATYSGDSNYSTVIATAVTQNVSAFAATINVTGPGTTPVVNTAVTLTAQLAGTGIAFTPTPPSGKFNFMAGGTTIATCGAVSVNATGGASCTTSTLVAPSDAISVTYSGDTNFTTAAAGTMTQNVSAFAATIHVTGPGTTIVNTPVTLAAQLAGTGITFTPTAPSGNFNFMAGGTTIATCGTVAVNATGGASCQTSALVAPSDAISVTYSGDSNFTTAAAGTMTQNETKVTSTVTVSTTTPSVAVGVSVTFTAQVGPAGSIAPVAPTGKVSFLINGISNSDCPAVTLTSASAGAATCTTTSLVVPADTITATYAGDTNFTGPVTSPTFAESVGKTPATTTLASSLPVSASVNQTVTFTATVKPPSGTVLPTGTVTFTQGATNLCGATGISNTTGIATCNYAFSSVTAGTTITATYSGDQSFSSGTPATVSQVVTAASTTTSVVSSPNPSATNQQVSFTATVTPAFTAGTAIPAGKVTFTNTTSSTTLCANLTIAAGVVPVCNYTFTSSGTYDVVATYTSTSSNFTGSASGATADAQVVGAGGTSVTLTSSPSPSFVDELVTFNATINFTSSGSTVPTGTVVYYDGATTLCTFPTAGSSAFTGGIVPACAVALSSQGNHSITAAFTTSDTNFSSKTSSILTQVVNQAATTTTVAATPSPSTVNQLVTFTATVTRAFTAGTATPTGKVTFTLASTTAASPAPGTVLCLNVPVTTAANTNITTAACGNTLTTFALNGSYIVTAAYSGDVNFTSGTPGSDTQSVGAGTTSVVLTSQPSPSTVNQQVKITATINFISSGTSVPTGTLTYTDTLTNTVLCKFTSITATGTGTGNVPACTVPFYTAATHPVLVTYSGDSNFTGSTSTLNLIVNPTATATTVTGPSTSAVNQSVTFTATIAPAITPFAGSTNPTGTVSFSYILGGVNVPLCTTSIPVGTTGSGASAVTSAACSASLPSLGAYTITAIYTGDSNFSTSTSAAFALQVGATATSVSVTSSLSTSIATQPVTFVATVNPTIIGSNPTSPTGSIAFSSTDGTLGTAAGELCGAVPLTAAVGGSATATCAVQFPATTGGTINVSATYSGDKNFQGSSTPAPGIPQVVENFGLAFTAPVAGTSAALAPVILTQGYSNANDPFNATMITATVTTLGGYTDQVNFTCTVTTPSASTPGTQVPVTDPSCSVSPAFLPSASNGALVTYTVSASANAPVGSYTVSLTGSDASVATLSHTTMPPVTVYVVGVSTALTLAPGATGTANNAVFDTAAAPAGDKLQTFACGVIVPFTNGKPGAPLTGTGYLTCTGQATAVTGFQTTVPISITPVVSTTAQLQRSSAVTLAAFLGVPFLALMGWVGGRKSPRRNFFRFIGLILLIVGLSYATGCGTGFTPPTTTGASVLPAGSYYVQVVATDNQTPTPAMYYAVVPLTVNQ